MRRMIKLEDILLPERVEKYGVNTDYSNREFAICYIGEDLLEEATHKDCLAQYLLKNDLCYGIIDASCGSVTEEEMDEVDEVFGFASYLKGADGQDYVVIYEDTLYALSLETMISVVKEKYPAACIAIESQAIPKGELLLI